MVTSKKQKIGPASAQGFTQPAEFEPQEAVWLGWPTEQFYTGGILDTRNPIADIVVALQNNQIQVRIMVTGVEGEAAVRLWLTQNGYSFNYTYVQYVWIDQVDIWQRDFGPIFLRNEFNQLGMAGFQQSQWGYSTPTDPISQAMAAVPGHVADYLGIAYRSIAETVSEGGDRIVNGQGTLLVNRTLELERNPGADQQTLEEEFKATLGASKVIWLLAGARDDLHATWGPIPYRLPSGQPILLYGPQTTGGHLDEFVRFIDANTIALAQVSFEEAARDPIAAANYANFELANRILSEATDQDGNPFEIRRFPAPDPEYLQVTANQPMYQWLSELSYPPDVPQFPTDGSPIYVVKAASYANYLITNGLVVAPQYPNETKTAQMVQFLEQNYLRQVFLVDPSALNYAGGGIHCSTQQQPTGTT